MRVNVYAEEITGEVTVIGPKSGGSDDLPFVGLRVYLRSPEELHHTEEDDDRSAVTFWFDTMADLNDFRERLYVGSPTPPERKAA